MKYEVGNNYGVGRPKGSPNKTTAETKELISELVFNREEFIKAFDAKLVDPNFSYNSGDNNDWETVLSLRKLIKNFVDPNFTI